MERYYEAYVCLGNMIADSKLKVSSVVRSYEYHHNYLSENVLYLIIPFSDLKLIAQS